MSTKNKPKAQPQMELHELDAGFPLSEREKRELDKLASLRAQAQAINARPAIEEGAIGFMPAALVQATIPHAKPGKAQTKYVRRNGNVMVQLIADPDIGMPYGTISRLVYAWMMTEAVKLKSPRLPTPSLTQFVGDELHRPKTGGKRGAINAVREHLERVRTTSVAWTYSYSQGHGYGHGELEMRVHPVEVNHRWWTPPAAVAEDGVVQLWADPAPKPPKEARHEWQSEIVLNERFYKALIERPVPIDMRVVRALADRRSPLAMDIYCWLTYRLSRLEKETVVPWAALQGQFGADYGRPRAFREAFKDWLPKVLCFYPQAKVNLEETGLRLIAPGVPHVPLLLRSGT